jgi:hypothetical protein
VYKYAVVGDVSVVDCLQRDLLEAMFRIQELRILWVIDIKNTCLFMLSDAGHQTFLEFSSSKEDLLLSVDRVSDLGYIKWSTISSRCRRDRECRSS